MQLRKYFIITLSSIKYCIDTKCILILIMYVYLFVCLYDVCLQQLTLQDLHMYIHLYVVPSSPTPPPPTPFCLKTFYIFVVNFFLLYQIPFVSLTLCSTEYCPPSGQSSQVDLFTLTSRSTPRYVHSGIHLHFNLKFC